jgi:hypothetical protein
VKVFSPPKREGKVDMIQGNTVEEIVTILADKLLAEKII